MRFLVDECAGPALAEWLRQQQHDVLSIFEESAGLDDLSVLDQAVAENRIVITTDKDFGELVFRDERPHRGIVLLRLEDQRSANKIAVVGRLLEQYADFLADHFVVATEDAVRIVGHDMSAGDS